MRKSRFTDAQIIGMIKEQEAGLPTADLCRKHGLSAPTEGCFVAPHTVHDHGQFPRHGDLGLLQIAALCDTHPPCPDRCPLA